MQQIKEKHDEKVEAKLCEEIGKCTLFHASAINCVVLLVNKVSRSRNLESSMFIVDSGQPDPIFLIPFCPN